MLYLQHVFDLYEHHIDCEFIYEFQLLLKMENGNPLSILPSNTYCL